jgi:hypothetical protein
MNDETMSLEQPSISIITISSDGKGAKAGTVWESYTLCALAISGRYLATIFSHVFRTFSEAGFGTVIRQKAKMPRGCGPLPDRERERI